MKRIGFGLIRVLASLLMLIALGTLVACTAAPAEPAVKIQAPAEGTVIPTGDIVVSVEITNFRLVEELGQSNTPGEGHIHYFLDAEPPVTPGQPAITAPGTYVPTNSPTHIWLDVAEGPHTVAVELVNNDHTPLSSPVIDKVTVTIHR